MRLNLPFFLLILTPLIVFSQKHDHIWYLGYGGGTETPFDDEWGIAILTFTPDSLSIEENQYYETDFSMTNGIISDSSGNLVAYTNGQHIYGKNHEIMENGDTIGTNDVHTGYNIRQGAIILPAPLKMDRYYVFNTEYKYVGNDISGFNLFMNKIKIDSQNPNGLVTEKRKIVINDYVALGKITAIKHANGCDWWLTVPKWNSNLYYQLLIDSSGVKQIDTLVTETVNEDGAGPAKYSPDGSKYIRALSKYIDGPYRIDIFDFDRCTGKFSNQQTKIIDTLGFGVGLEFSTDSRFLYIFRTLKVFQFDLTAANIFDSVKTVAEYDGFLSDGTGNTGTFFSLSQVGPDGKIYTASTRYGKHLHYMNFPNREGTACKVIQHGVELPVYNNSSVPNLPNFRLGPVDGSSCDTLGLDNHPLAGFRWDFEDTLSPLHVTFTDLSTYEPDSWKWIFGDGVIYDTLASGEVFHTFPAPGIYSVCLVASNVNSSDTVCYDIQVGETVGVSNFAHQNTTNIKVWPNPARHQTTLSLSEVADWQRVDVLLTDQLGRQVGHTAWRGPVGQIQITELPEGVFILHLSVEGRMVGETKLVKI